MNTSRPSNGYLSSLLFELGLALRLNKLTAEDVSSKIPVAKIRKLVDAAESRQFMNWDDSHIKPGDLLRSALEIHGISQAQLAKELKVPPQKINDLIKGRLTLTKNWAKRISTILGVSYKVFL
ncbi:MAG: helix-turn-helix transcriptional regulator [Pseudomonadota bacterium]